MAEQPRVTDLLPRRLPAYFLLLLLGVALIGGIAVLASWVPALPLFASPDGAGAFDLARTGSLASWFSSVALLAAAVVSGLVYSVRRYRTNDYRGYYRIWLWAATCWAALSLDATAGLRLDFQRAMTELTGTPLYADGSLWWVVPYLVLLSALGSRLLLDTWPARLSTAAFLTAGGCATLAVGVRLGWGRAGDGPDAAMLAAGAEMLGCWMLLVATTLHARYVVLDAEGLLPVPEPEGDDSPASRGQETESCEGSEGGEWVAVDAPHPSPVPAPRRRPVQPEPEAEAPVGRKLTKQEKKALRQRLQRERLQREQSQQSQWG